MYTSPSTSLLSLDIILRAETVEMVQAGDKCDFIGTLIAIPDVAQLAMQSEYIIMLPEF